MIRRYIGAALRERLAAMPAVALFGPRQVGKTTLALELVAERGEQAVYLDLQRERDRRVLDDADAFLRRQTGHLVVLDEVHRVPGLFPILRGVIDARRRAGDRTGQFLLLGSASLDLQRQVGETLAGRISYIELPPLNVDEYLTHRGDEESPAIATDRLWLRGGFPDSLLAASDALSLRWREDFVRSYLERDIPQFAPRTSATAVGRLWRMLAHAHGTLLNKARLAGSLEVSAPTVAAWLDLLTDLLLVRQLPPWSGNLGKRLVRTPKVYLRDSGLVHALLDILSHRDLLAHPVVGASWEGFAIEQIIAAAGARYQAMFFRTSAGAEADLVLERGGRADTVIEIKRSSAPTISAGLLVARADLSPDHTFVVHGGDGSWVMRDDIVAISLPELVDRLRASHAT